MAVNLSLFAGAGWQFFDNSGNVLTGGKIYTYAAGTTTPQPTYTTNSGLTPNANPIILNASGRLSGSSEIWLTANINYKFVLTDSNDVLIGTYDNITGAVTDANALFFTPDANSLLAPGPVTVKQAMDDITDTNTGSSVVGFKQTGANATSRTVLAKLQEYISVKDFGAVGNGVADDTAAFNAAIALANTSTDGISVNIPNGVYRVTSSLTTINKPLSWFGDGRSTTRLNFEGCNGFRYDLGAQSRTFINCTVSNLSILTNTNTYTGFYFKGKQTFAPHDAVLALNGVSFDSTTRYTSGGSSNNEWAIGLYIDDADEVILEDCYLRGSDGNNVYATRTSSIGVKIVTCTGFKANFCNLYLMGIGFDVSGQSEGHIFQGCTVVAVDQGFYYHDLVTPANNHTFSDTHVTPYTVGINFVNNTTADNAEAVYINGCFILEREPNVLKPSYTNIIFNCRSSAITNCTLQSNRTTTLVRKGIFLSADSNLVSNVAFFNQGILFDVKTAGASKYSQASNCTRVGAVTNITTGDDGFLLLSSIPSGVTENTSRADVFVFQSLDKNQKLQITGSRILLGSRDSGVRYIDFLSNIGGTAGYDGRILSQGGGATTGQAEMFYYGVLHNFSNRVRPQLDNTYSCGTADLRWSEIFAANGTINTSDEREKQDIKDLSEAERQVAVAIKGLIKSFRFKDAVAKKGDKARIHFGVMAQQVAEAFTSNGLDPHQYALFCYDEWDATEEILDDEGNQVKPAVEAGNRYGIRYEELLAFVVSAL